MSLKRDRTQPVKLLGGSLLNPLKCCTFPRPPIWFSCFHEAPCNGRGVWWGPCSDTWQRALGFPRPSASLHLHASWNPWTSPSSSPCLPPPSLNRGVFVSVWETLQRRWWKNVVTKLRGGGVREEGHRARWLGEMVVRSGWGHWA